MVATSCHTQQKLARLNLDKTIITIVLSRLRRASFSKNTADFLELYFTLMQSI